jgi:hypothetical protein
VLLIFDFDDFKALKKGGGHVEFDFAVYFFLNHTLITYLREHR